MFYYDEFSRRYGCNWSKGRVWGRLNVRGIWRGNKTSYLLCPSLRPMNWSTKVHCSRRTKDFHSLNHWLWKWIEPDELGMLTRWKDKSRRERWRGEGRGCDSVGLQKMKDHCHLRAGDSHYWGQKRKEGKGGVKKSSVTTATRELGILAYVRDEGRRGGRGGVVGSLQTMKEHWNMRTRHSHTW